MVFGKCPVSLSSDATDLINRFRGLAMRFPLLASTLASGVFLIILSVMIASCVLPTVFPVPIDQAAEDEPEPFPGTSYQPKPKPKIKPEPSPTLTSTTRTRSNSTTLRRRRSRLTRRASSSSRLVSFKSVCSLRAWVNFSFGCYAAHTEN